MRRMLFWAVGILLLLLFWGVAAFVQNAETRIATLPARVEAQLRVEGSQEVPLNRIPRNLINATVAVEDRSFWTNPGVSAEGVARAALVDVASQAFVEGGSTITQQLVRDMLLGYQKTLHRKAVEIAYALLTTRRFPKTEILDLYLNEVNYGQGALGVASAAQVYFGMPLDSLDLSQCALLAGLPQNPEGLDPFQHLSLARQRQAQVLAAMVAVHDITPAEARQAAQAPLDLLPTSATAGA